MFTSCTNDQPVNSKADIAKTDVIANIVTTSTNSTTGKNVNRGTIYAWIKDINVTATSSIWNYSVSEIYTLVASGGSNLFSIKDVAVGANTFVATSTGYDANKVFAMNTVTPAPSVTTFVTAQTEMSAMKLHNPYALYAGTTNATIANGVPNTVDFNMTTTHGRLISAFMLTDDIPLRANTFATVTAHVDGETDLVSGQIKNNIATFEWSNATSIVGKSVVYTIRVYDDTAPNVILKTYTLTKPIQASVSYACIYTIDRDHVLNTAEDHFTFTFQPWTEVDCSLIFDNDGYNCNGYNQAGHYDKAHDTNHAE